MTKSKSKTEISSSYIYVCRSPILKGCCKIGFHKGTPYSLYKRYQTPFTNKVFFYLFATETPEQDEKIIHRILKPYNISNELFRIEDDDHLQYVFGYMAKMVTGCDRAILYSREKYGFPRSKGKWPYEKAEKKDEEIYNSVLDKIVTTGGIIESPEDNSDDKHSEESIDENTEETIVDQEMVIEQEEDGKDTEEEIICSQQEDKKGDVDEEMSSHMSKLEMEEKINRSQVILESPEDVEDIQEKYVDNPFGKWSFKGTAYEEKRLKRR